jgi:hypothetical protein
MGEIEAVQFQSLSIVFVGAVNTKLASLFGLDFSLQIYMEHTASTSTIVWLPCYATGPCMPFLGGKPYLDNEPGQTKE